jgi:hypothetical protein
MGHYDFDRSETLSGPAQSPDPAGADRISVDQAAMTPDDESPTPPALERSRNVEPSPERDAPSSLDPPEAEAQPTRDL